MICRTRQSFKAHTYAQSTAFGSVSEVFASFRIYEKVSNFSMETNALGGRERSGVGCEGVHIYSLLPAGLGQEFPASHGDR